MYQSSHVYTESAEYTKWRKRRYLAKPPSHVPGLWHSPSPVGRADCVCLHGRPCVCLPFAAACCYTLFYLLMMPAARLVCKRPSSNFQYFRTPLANSLLSLPNSVEYGNSKTTTLLPSAKCTRPLFQGRTGCGGRSSGWHDIVTCQRLVPCYSCMLSFTEIYSRRLMLHQKTTGFLYHDRCSGQTFCSPARTPSNAVILKQLLCCTRQNVRVHSSKVELAAAGVQPVGRISSHASV